MATHLKDLINDLLTARAETNQEKESAKKEEVEETQVAESELPSLPPTTTNEYQFTIDSTQSEPMLTFSEQEHQTIIFGKHYTGGDQVTLTINEILGQRAQIHKLTGQLESVRHCLPVD